MPPKKAARHAPVKEEIIEVVEISDDKDETAAEAAPAALKRARTVTEAGKHNTAARARAWTLSFVSVVYLFMRLLWFFMQKVHRLQLQLRKP